MKKFMIQIIIALTCLMLFGNIFNTYAEKTKPESKEKDNIIYVTAKVPGADCADKKGDNNLYKCKMKPGFASIMQIMGKLLKYFTFIAGLLAVLMLVVGGIMYSMGGANEEYKTKSKDFIIKSLMGLVLLLMSGTILYAVAPWVYN